MKPPTMTALLAAWHSSTCAGCTDLRAQVRQLAQGESAVLRQTRLALRQEREQRAVAEDDRARQRDEIASLERRIHVLLAADGVAA